MTHHRPLLNGTSGFAPPGYVQLDAMLHASPISDATIGQLNRMDCELIVAHADAITAPTRAWLGREIAARRIHFVRRFSEGVHGDWVFTLRAGGSDLVTPELAAFLRNDPTYNDITFGIFDTPAPGSRNAHPFFSGWALSPYGIHSVELLLENGSVRYQATCRPEPALNAMFPGYPVPNPRFTFALGERPAGVSEQTDVQAEITDGRGKKTRLDDRWFDWP